MSSTHKVEIVPVKLEPHNNADSLSLVRVDDYQIVVKTSVWEGITKAAYIPPDNVVDVTRPEFAWLKSDKHPATYRIKPVKLRGELSMGILVPYEGELGEDVTEKLGVTPWEPELVMDAQGDCAKGPPLWAGLSKYDIENFRKCFYRR